MLYLISEIKRRRINNMDYSNLSVIIPFKAKCPEREKIFNWVLKRTQLILPKAEIIVGSDDRNPHEYFNKSMAINDAVEKSTRDFILILDADAFIDAPAFEKAYKLIKQNAMVVVSKNIRFLSSKFSKKLLKLDAGIGVKDIANLDDEVLYEGGSVSMALLIHKEKFVEMNGFDERFVGWGGEDDAFYFAYSTLFGERITTDYTGYHIYHPRLNNSKQSKTLEEENINASKDNPLFRNNLKLTREYCSLKGNYSGMKRYMNNNSVNSSNNRRKDKMLKIFHTAPYSPNACGIYEACRDMMRADVLAGHDVYFVDNGFEKDGKIECKPIGTVDDRGGFKLVTSNPIDIDGADLIVAHTMPRNEYIIRNQVPIVFIAHGRPLDSFRLENNSDNLKSYTYMHDVANYPRVKKIVHFWSEFTPFWSIFPENKVVALDYPTIDQIRFSPKGEKHIIEDKNKGEYNILICDSWRTDMDMFEIFNGAIQAAREIKNIKFHFYAMEAKDGKLKKCWEVLVHELRKLGALGETCGRMADMEKVYRSMDAVLTPHRIIVRTISESLSCGTPVIADEKCKVAQFGCDPHDPYSVADAIKRFVASDKKQNVKDVLKIAPNFNSIPYSIQMDKIYKEILK
jgi:glycosyltransferase involved in cell wall biosynthesis